MSEVYARADRTWSLFRLDDALGYPRPGKGEKAAALEDWYWSVGDTPIGNLTDLDLATAMRQSLHIPIVLTEMMRRLEVDPYAGRYPGELLVTLGYVKVALWRERPADRSRAIAMGRAALRAGKQTLDEDSWFGVKREIEGFVSNAMLAGDTSPTLTVVKAPEGTPSYPRPLSPGMHLQIGCAPTSQIRVLGAGLGRTHAVASGELDGVRLRAQAHDVFVNGKRIEEVMLHDGDIIDMGQVKLEFHAGREETPS